MHLPTIFHHNSDNSVMDHPNDHTMAATQHSVTISDFHFTPENQSQWIAAQKAGQKSGYFTFQGQKVMNMSPLAAQLRAKANFVYGKNRLSNDAADRIIIKNNANIQKEIAQAGGQPNDA